MTAARPVPTVRTQHGGGLSASPLVLFSLQSKTIMSPFLRHGIRAMRGERAHHTRRQLKYMHKRCDRQRCTRTEAGSEDGTGRRGAPKGKAQAPAPPAHPPARVASPHGALHAPVQISAARPPT